MSTLLRVRELDQQLAGRKWIGAYDPDGVHYGMPTFPYRCAPDGLLTIRQLRARGLRPGGQDITAQIMWRRGNRHAYLYREDLAKPKRTATPVQWAAIEKALRARRTCPTCGIERWYYIPLRYGECLDCAGIYPQEPAA